MWKSGWCKITEQWKNLRTAHWSSNLPRSVLIGQNKIQSVWNLDMVCNDELLMTQVSKTCQSTYLDCWRCVELAQTCPNNWGCPNFCNVPGIVASWLLNSVVWNVPTTHQQSSKCAMKQSQKLPCLTCLNCFTCTFHPIMACIVFCWVANFRSKIKEKLPKATHFFPHLGPVAWNKLPISICYAATKSQFEPKLKTTLFFSAHDGLNS